MMEPFDAFDTGRRVAASAATPPLTAALPGVGGRTKVEPEDFEVEEIPAYEPSGAGEHLFLWIEKRDVAAEQLQRHVARVLGVSTSDVGMAGLKDRRAVTRQYVSVPAARVARIAELNTEAIRVLKAERHGNKLKTGHLRGNRFSVLVREVVENAEQIARPIAERVARQGFPNYFGSQRFGHEGETLALGFDLLAGRKRPQDLPAARRRFLSRLSLSAVQSELFNRALAERLRDGLLHQVLAGDVMEVVASGGKFIAEDVAREQPRYDAGEIVPTGPMFGPKMRQPAGEPLERERRLLEACELKLEDFRRQQRLLPGTRRACIVWPAELAIQAEPEGLRLSFTLPPGTYATTLLAEFCKMPHDHAVDDSMLAFSEVRREYRSALRKLAE
ncbi:MAG: tRNA pseudouridine(13) synthase TruD [Planctomycetales bacterium]